jgi:site-specific recombinase XerD
MSETSQKHRTNPIKESMVRIKNYPDKLVLFKVSSSSNWWVRYYLGKVFRESTGTNELSLAKEYAKEFMVRCHYKTKNKPSKLITKFEQTGNLLIEQQGWQIARGEKGKKLNVNDKSLLNTYMIPYFSNIDISKIDNRDLEGYLFSLQKFEFKKTTLKKHLNLLSKIFQLAYEKRYIDRIPRLPAIKLEDSPRPWFSHAEYNHLKGTTTKLILNKEIVRGHQITDEMRYLITFMMNSFIRPNDLKTLRHRNIQVASNKGRGKKSIDFLKIFYEESKTGKNAPTSTMADAVGIYNDLLEFHKKNNSPHSKNDYLFFPKIKNRDFALRTMARLFNHILDVAELKNSPTNEQRTLYSLRHSSISFRLLDGVDVLTIANNAKTSVDMIQRFYANHLKNEKNVGKIQLQNRK